jgi:hypothetical protein
VMSGPPAGYPPPPAPAPPAPVPVPAGQGSSRTGLVLILVGVAVVIVLLGSGVLAAVLLSRPSPAPTPMAASTTPASAATSAPAPAPTAAPTTDAGTAAPDPGGTTKPTLRAVPAKTVVGPTFGATEQTYTMAFQGWPFAFRTPKTWGCMAGKVDKIPDAKAWVCIDEGNPNNRERANVMLRACKTTCTPAERTSMNNDWFDQPAKAKQAGDDHSYLVETPANSKGLYSIDYSRFFGPPGQPLKWQVGVYVEAPSGTKADVQKIVNDIASQTA